MLSIQVLSSENLDLSYEEFYRLNYELLVLYRKSYPKMLVNYWLVEHVFYRSFEPEEEEGAVEPNREIEVNLPRADEQLYSDLLDKLKSLTPSQFESLAVKVLQKMGYGQYSKDSGSVTGRPGDRGIDGVIQGDRLGFENIYVQAKRFDSNSVNEDRVQAFVGAISGKKGNKGVFITTSTFTRNAIDYANGQGGIIIKLIDGEALVRYRVEFKLGVKTIRTIEQKQVEDAFFEGLQ
jgi:restriction system protein